MDLKRALCCLSLLGSRALAHEGQLPLGNNFPAEPTEAAATVSASIPPPPWRNDLLSLHKSLIEIESVTGHEHAVGTFLADHLTGRGYVVKLQHLPARNNTPPDEGRFNVLAWKGEGDPSSSRRRPPPPARLLVSSHIDVVPPHIPYDIDDGAVAGDTTVRGRGSVDAKASVAAQLTAVEELLRAGDVDAADLMLLYVVGEERSGDGMRHFSDELGRQQQQQQSPRFEAAIFGEPTENKLACGHKGHMMCTVEARGRTGHSGYPWLGKSANEVLIRALVKILDADLGSSERFGNSTVNVGILDGGVAANVIPESSTGTIAVRVGVGPQESGHEIVRERIERILKDTDEDLKLECENQYGAVECDCDVEGFESIVVNYGTDIPNLKGNHTRYLYGPGDILVAHSDHEHLQVRDLETAVEGYKKLIKHALSQ